MLDDIDFYACICLHNDAKYTKEEQQQMTTVADKLFHSLQERAQVRLNATHRKQLNSSYKQMPYHFQQALAKLSIQQKEDFEKRLTEHKQDPGVRAMSALLESGGLIPLFYQNAQAYYSLKAIGVDDKKLYAAMEAGDALLLKQLYDTAPSPQTLAPQAAVAYAAARQQDPTGK
jgi:Rps23 Pro-64 3,4-dihydroxylase Tpa1-like proline 4-hydroxylase